MGYTIPAAAWKQYKDKLRRIDSKAADLMQKYAEAHGFQIDDEMVQYAYAVSTKYGEASGALAADMYDSIAEYYMENSKSARNIPYAEVADPASERDVKNALYSAEAQNRTGEIPQRVSRLVRQCGADTVMKNAIRDRAEWAWVPSGDTCAFCLTLASNGWQPASRTQLNGNHAQHIHNNCDCTFAIRFDKETNVEGYDPKVYRRIYDRNGGDINAIRRELYRLSSQKKPGSFADDVVVDNHYKKHKNEFEEDISKEEYLRRAEEMKNRPLSRSVSEMVRSDNSIAKYDKATNEFIVINPDGSIRTYFKPEKGESYWEDEHERNK